jgi:hypothetical protein
LCAGNFASSNPDKVFQPAWFIMSHVSSEVKLNL